MGYKLEGMTKEMTYCRYLLRRMLPAAGIFFALETMLRIVFLIRERVNVSLSPLETVKMMTAGAVFDLAVFTCFMIPLVLFLLVLPASRHLGRIDRAVTELSYFCLVYILLFDAVSEWVFWDEFDVRFNFIAVDYLVYTQEVLANIWESYPLVWLLGGMAVVTALIHFLASKKFLPAKKPVSLALRERALFGLGYLFIPLALFFAVSPQYAEVAENAYVNEVAKNGIYSLFSAFRHNELDYRQFYLTEYKDSELPPIRDLLSEDEMGYRFTSADPDDITRLVPGRGAELHKNVIIIAMESMGANFMERFGGKKNVTPVLDALTRDSLFFSNTYATGTRTVRGLEAISLSIPPTPGQSILRRPGNENLASIGFVFKDRGYDTKFIYGGYGYFDNMNYFFENNGFDIVDRASFKGDEKTFVNAWGVCDEDIFNKVLKEADASYKNGKPFMHVVMTISNHRPYTFPAGRIDLPSEGGGRMAGVKYADYAIGKLLKDAKDKPWFKDTVFVIVADHTAGSAGKVELTQDKYHIPLFIYAPDFVKPQIVGKMVSQIDIAPTLFGLLNFSYLSRFYGEDILSDQDEKPHAFISNYEHMGYIDGDSLVVLRPGKTFARYKDGKLDPDGANGDGALLEAISYYKHASDWRRHIGRIESTIPAVSVNTQ